MTPPTIFFFSRFLKERERVEVKKREEEENT
jgi:hypothetical protein